MKLISRDIFFHTIVWMFHDTHENFLCLICAHHALIIGPSDLTLSGAVHCHGCKVMHMGHFLVHRTICGQFFFFGFFVSCLFF